ncbi:uncharacterized protein At3g28850-like [Bidens hawaiensis]|uniref:uncharacterized protein At3g28850-like n=1 Tax=Bidens hawaiensis TaxID=980011 RepID=UPI00404B5D5D
MGCVSSHLLNQDDDFTQSNFSHHIVSLTSTTYGLLTLDPSSSSSPTTLLPTPPRRFTLASLFKSSLSEPPTLSEPPPEIIDSFELMADLEKPQENPNPDHKNIAFIKPMNHKPDFLNGFEEICPPKGENKVVIYTTTLRGVRKTFEECNVVRAVLEGFRVLFIERDVSMDRGFKEELWGLMKGKDKCELVPPRVFVKGRYVGGFDEVLKIFEDGCLGRLLEGLPRLKVGYVCEVCGGARFLPCVVCNGSCKIVRVLRKGSDGKQLGKSVSVKCRDCNENGLVCCPVCS